MASGRRDADEGGGGGTYENWLWDSTWGLSLALVGLGFALFQLWHQYFLEGWRVGMQLRCAMISVIYHKALRLSLAALGRVTVGYVVNLATNDIEKFQVVSAPLPIPSQLFSIVRRPHGDFFASCSGVPPQTQ